METQKEKRFHDVLMLVKAAPMEEREQILAELSKEHPTWTALIRNQLAGEHPLDAAKKTPA